MFLNIDKHDKAAIALQEVNGDSVTYAELTEIVADLAAHLEPRAVVFVLGDNDIATVVAYLSLIENKQVPLLISKDTSDELLNILDDEYQPAYYFLPKQLSDKISNMTDAETVLSYRDCDILRTSYAKYSINDSLAFLLSTSGTTGRPKLVRHELKNLQKSAENVAKSFNITAQERPLLELPLYYTMGLNVLNAHLLVGACGVLTKANLMSLDFYQQLDGERITSYVGVPYSYQIFDKLRFTRNKLPHLKRLYVGGGKLSNDLILKFANWCKDAGKEFICSYGKTECTARMAYLPFDQVFEHVGSIGRAVHGGELFLADDDGVISDQIGEGELVYKGDNVTMGYAYDRQDLLKGDEWQGLHYTGDIARRDAAGYYYIIGRINRFVKIFGLRISLDQIEKLIEDKFNVNCACIGNDEKIQIFIDNSEVLETAKDYLVQTTGVIGKVFEMRYIASIPTSAVGKIDYKALKSI